ncbi:MAG TPA: winged helix-turn-helix transcriptional regulator [Jatrophihabitantaceae bacterium]
MSGQRLYGDPCGVARSLDVIGDRWALLVVRDLLLGPKRFNDLLDGLVGASPNVVTQRLSELTDAGVIRRRKLPAPAEVWVYELTQRGRDLEPVLLALGRWGSDAPHRSRRRVLGHDSLVLSVKASFDAGRVAGLAGHYELWIDGEAFGLSVGDGRLEATRGPAAHPDAVIRADAKTLTAVVTGQLSAQAARAAGGLAIEGPRRAASRAAALLTPGIRPAGASTARDRRTG